MNERQELFQYFQAKWCEKKPVDYYFNPQETKISLNQAIENIINLIRERKKAINVLVHSDDNESFFRSLLKEGLGLRYFVGQHVIEVQDIYGIYLKENEFEK